MKGDVMQPIAKPEENAILSGLRHPPEDMYYENPQKLAGQYTVFLVEDDADDRLQMISALKKSPYIYNIRCFGSGQDLKQHLVEIGYFSNALLHNIPTLVLLDIHMPGASGLRVLQDLKSHPITRDIPVIIVTGDTSVEMTLDAYRHKANAFVSKPIHLDFIHEVIYKGQGWPSTPFGQQ
jgi:CheY-like chemotaxis protein